MIKHLEVKTYQYGDVKVMVEINYNTEKISLVETNHNDHSADFRTQPKKYIFVQRELSYMNGWRNVLLAMGYAIDEAEKDLKDYIEARRKAIADDTTAILMEATDIVKRKSGRYDPDKDPFNPHFNAQKFVNKRKKK